MTNRLFSISSSIQLLQVGQIHVSRPVQQAWILNAKFRNSALAGNSNRGNCVMRTRIRKPGSTFLNCGFFRNFNCLSILMGFFSGGTYPAMLKHLNCHQMGFLCRIWQTYLTTMNVAKSWTRFMLPRCCPKVGSFWRLFSPLSKSRLNMATIWPFTTIIQFTNVIVGLTLFIPGGGVFHFQASKLLRTQKRNNP